MSATPFSMAGRVALVTGASGALGAHFAQVLSGAGASVVLAARNMAKVSAVAAGLAGPVMTVKLDVTEDDEFDSALDAIQNRFGGCDVLINNAGVATTKAVLDHSAEDWDAVMDTNLRGPFLLSQRFARNLVAAERPGSIINIASILGLRVISGVASYGAAKAGLIQMTKHMALELARHRIRINALAPGYVATEINADFFASEAGRAMVKRIPQRRLGRLDDLTGPLLLLASDAGAHMTGSVLVVDGGHSINSL